MSEYDRLKAEVDQIKADQLAKAIRSPEAEAYWREASAVEFDAFADGLVGPLEYYGLKARWAARFLREQIVTAIKIKAPVHTGFIQHPKCATCGHYWDPETRPNLAALRVQYCDVFMDVPPVEYCSSHTDLPQEAGT